jgi:hypothetical protein
MIQIFVNDFFIRCCIYTTPKKRLSTPSFQQVYMTGSFVSTFFREVGTSFTVHVRLCPEAI